MIFAEFVRSTAPAHPDPAHDFAHIQRVVSNARALAHAEEADLSVVIPAAWLHDCVIIPKHAPERARASRLAAETASRFLREAGFPGRLIPAISHAIHAHSYSARVEPRSLEAKVVQDADRLDALGAIGIARTLLLGGTLGGMLYDVQDPFAQRRAPDDRQFVIDHFFSKLLRLAQQMQTPAAREEASRRTEFMRRFLEQLEDEITASPSPLAC